MGLDYHIHCIDCDQDSEQVEYSIVSYYQWKSIPNDPDTVQSNWTEFLVNHSGHKLQFLDAFGRETDPKQTRGGYVLGIEDYKGKKTVDRNCSP